MRRLKKNNFLEKGFVKFNTRLLLGFSLLLIFLGISGTLSTSLKFEKVTATDTNSSATNTWPIKIPFYQNPTESLNLKDDQQYLLSGKVYKSGISQNYIKLNVDDCIEEIKVNGRDVNLGAEFKGQNKNEKICSPDTDYHLNLGGFLKTGENDLEIKIKNNGGYTGLLWDNSFKDGIFILFLTILNFGFLGLILFFGRLFKLSYLTSFILFLGIIIRQFYLSYTKFYQRAYDVVGTGHFGYIEYVYKNWQIPDPTAGWEYYQPPLYYFVSAAFWKLASFFGVSNFYTFSQIINLVFFIGFLFVGILILKEYFEKKYLLLSASLLIFWPSGIIHSVRVTNDVLYYLFFTLSLYFLIKWQKVLVLEKPENELISNSKADITRKTKVLQTPQQAKGYSSSNKFFYLSFIMAGLAISTKLSGVIILPVIAFTWLWEIYKNKKEWLIFLLKTYKPIALGVVLTVLAVVLNLWKKIELNIKNPGKYDLLITNQDGLSSGLFIRNNLYNYLHLGLDTWLKDIYLNPFSDIGGREFFLQYLLKSSLFAEFSFNLEQTLDLAVLINFCLMLMVLILCLNLVTLKKPLLEKYLVIILSLVFSIAAIIFLKNKNACSCNQDFRFIFPSLVSVVILTILGIQRIDGAKYPVLKWLSVSLICCFILASIYFFWAISLPINF